MKPHVLLGLCVLLLGCGGGGGDAEREPPNAPPTANAGLDQAVDELASVTLSGSGLDNDGSIASYAWSQVSGTSVDLQDASSASASFTAPDKAEGTEELVIRLTVTDNRGAAASDEVSVTVSYVNLPPVADAGPDMIVLAQSMVTLMGSGEDSDGTIASYQWSLSFGPQITLVDADTATASFTAPKWSSLSDDFTLVLTVTDDLGAAASDEVKITINAPPTARAGSDRLVNELTEVSLRGSGSDPDGSIASFTWQQVSGPSVTLDPPDARVTRFTSPEVGDDIQDLTFRLTVTDSQGATDSDEVVVTVEKLFPIMGKVTFDLVPMVAEPRVKLDYGAIEVRPVRGATVRLRRGNSVIDTAFTDHEGMFSILASKAGEVHLRVRAEIREDESNWDVRVLDNTRNDALYTMDGAPFLASTTTPVQKLHAASGWTGDEYAQPRVAAPFAILDVLYDAIELVRSADPDASFEPIEVLWSSNNINARGADGRADYSTGRAGGAHFLAPLPQYGMPAAIYLLGDEDMDTDEYDRTLIAHEWGHYFEVNFSRSDTLAGGHGPGDQLDMRVAFSEGLATALEAMIIDRPYYGATYGTRQGNGWIWDVENINQRRRRSGWFSEASIQESLYDLFDPANDDQLHLGFAPLYEVLVNDIPDTPAMVSIFPFIHGLKSRETEQVSGIDGLLASNLISEVVDDYGTGETNSGHPASPDVLPVYSDLVVNGEPVNVCSIVDFHGSGGSVYNKLGVRQYLKLKLSSGDYSLSATPTETPESASSSPQLCLYRLGRLVRDTASFGSPGAGRNCRESLSLRLDAGDYVLEVTDPANHRNREQRGRRCFDVQITNP